MKWYFKAWKQYADTKGRARRKEFWTFHLVNFIILIALAIIFITITINDPNFKNPDFDNPNRSIEGLVYDNNLYMPVSATLFFFQLAAFVPGWAVCVRRLHDVGRSGLSFMDYLFSHYSPGTTIRMLNLLISDSHPGENYWGLSPKYPEAPNLPLYNESDDKSGAQQLALIQKVDPVYPEIAKFTGLSGTVELRVKTNKEGAVTDVRKVSGHPILAEVSMAAVRQWRYSQSLINGEPVTAKIDVCINFLPDGTVKVA